MKAPAWLRRAHPVAFALAPVVTLYAANRPQVPPSDLLRPALVLLALAAALWPLLRRLARGDADRAAVALSAVLFVFCAYGAVVYAGVTVAEALPPLLEFGALDGFASEAPRYAMAAWSPARVWMLPFAAALLFGAVRLPLRARQDWNPVAWVVAGLLLGPPAAGIAASAVRPLVAAAPAPFLGAGDVPDLYLIVLDGYGRADVLRDEYGLDNGPFLRALEARGFTVAAKSRANYNVTTLALAAAMDLDYLPEGATETRQRMDSGALPTLMRARGMRYVFVPSGYEAVAVSSADEVLDGATPRGPVGALFEAPFPTPFESLLLDRTPLGAVRRRDTVHYDRHRRQLTGALEHVGRAAADGRPKFVFAHVLAPHPPFVFGPAGEAVYPPRQYSLADGDALREEPGAYRRAYADQLTHLNTRVLTAIDEVRKNARRPAVIVLMGDHGPRCETDMAHPEKTDLREGFSNLLAVSLPEGAADSGAVERLLRALEREAITPVNALRLVCSACYGVDLPRLPDRSLFPEPGGRGAYRDVTAALDASDDAAQVPGRAASKQ